MAKGLKVSVILPCYNEQDNLPNIISKCEELKSKSFNSYEFIFVNNGSKDLTDNILDQFCDGVSFRKLTIEKNIGYGNGIIEGCRMAKSDYIAWTHADLQTDIHDIDRGLCFLATDTSFVKGFRVNRKLVPKLLSIGMSVLTLFVQGIWVSEINAQPKIMPRKFFMEHVENAPLDFSLDLFYCLKAKSLKNYSEFPVQFCKRINGYSKGGESNLKTRLQIIFRTAKFIFKLKKNIN